MKKTLVFAAVVLCASPVWALKFMGPPTTDIEAGQLGIGLDWSHSQFDIRYDDEWWSSPSAAESDMYFARIFLGVADGAEISGHIGVSDVDQTVPHGYHSGNDCAWGVGTKLTFGKLGRVGVGAAFQLTSLGIDDRVYDGPSLTREKYDVYLWELAVGPSYETDGVYVYGGPFLHLMTGEVEHWVNSVRMTSMDIEEEEAEVGLYAGISAEIVENTDLGVEYHFTDDSWAIGVGIVHRFGASRANLKRTSSRGTRPWPTLAQKKPKAPVKKALPKEKLKTDADGEPVRDKDGNFIFVPVEEGSAEKQN